MRRQPFTHLCQRAALLARPPVADLHTHTTASDGEYTPSQVVAIAWREKLSAVAITDHDTTAGLAEAVETANGFETRRVEVVAGVEISTTLAGRGFHLLGYFIDPHHPELSAALSKVRAGRRRRFEGLAGFLAENGSPLAHESVEQAGRASSPGRRHLATLLVEAGHAVDRNDAFRRLLRPAAEAVPPAVEIDFAEAIRLVREAGGVSSLAHPPADLDRDAFASFAALGLAAVEVSFPAVTAGRAAELRDWAKALDLLVTGGSDCHGPTSPVIGAFGLRPDEFDRLRRSAAVRRG